VDALTIAIAPDQWAFIVVAVEAIVFLLGFQVGRQL